MDEQSIVYNGDEDDVIEEETRGNETEENMHPIYVESVSQSSTLPVDEPANLLGNGELIQINIQRNEEVTLHYQNEAVNANRLTPPQIFQDDSSNHSDSSSVTQLRSVTQLLTQESYSARNIESPTKKRRLSVDNEDEGSTCPICLDNWTNTGEHRICSLKCGHLFGLSCIKRWLYSETKKMCPTCKKRVNLKHDIRYIYAKKLIAIDTTEVDEVKKQLHAVTEEKNLIQIELTKSLCREHRLTQQVEDDKKYVQNLISKLEGRGQCTSSQNGMQISTHKSNDGIRFYMDKSLELSRDGGCRVLDYKDNIDVIVVSMKSPNSFFNGYGVRKISLTNYKPTAFIGLHNGQIRDVKFHSHNPWLISVALDKMVKVLDINSNNCIVSCTGTCPLWSCCWDTDDPTMFFVGEQQGSVRKYDMRHMTEPIATLFVPGDMSPVVSLAGIKRDPGTPIAHGGVSVCKLNSMWVFENTPNEYTRYHFPIEGPFVSMTYQNSTKQMLVSSRANSRTSFARHVICNINKDRDDLRCDTIHCFPGGTTQKMLSRSCFLSNTNDFIAAYHENQKCVYMWNINTGRKACSIPAHEPVLDLFGVHSPNGANILLNLTEKKLEFFKFNN